VNEVLEDNRGSLTDETGATPSWIELHNPERAEVSLAGWTISNDADDPGLHSLDDQLTIGGLEFLVLYADDQREKGPEHLGFELHKIGGVVRLYDPDGTLISTGEWIDEWNSDMARARNTDCCDDKPCWSSLHGGTPGETNLQAEVQDVPLFAAGSSWRYHDQGADLGIAWRQTDYDDTSWPAGPSPLGYGDDHQLTVLDYGPDRNDKYPTTYFRTTFQADDPAALDSLRLELLYDDGAAVYLNGTEILRTCLPEDLTASSYATCTASGSDETDYTAFGTDLDALVLGTNVLAVELHQVKPDSSDVGMDLAVIGEILLLPR
jgi:hypothetical protein